MPYTRQHRPPLPRGRRERALDDFNDFNVEKQRLIDEALVLDRKTERSAALRSIDTSFIHS